MKNIFKHVQYLLVICCVGSLLARAEAPPERPIRVGVLTYGTVNWEFDLIQRHAMDKQFGINLELVKLSSTNALRVALRGGAVDVIVGDWFWVADQNSRGQSYFFFPYSTAIGSLLVADNAGINSPADLRGKTLGVAGGPTGKSWLLYKAYAAQCCGIDLEREVTIKFAASPILNKLAASGKIDAVINYWHYASELKAQGMKTLVDPNQAYQLYGIEHDLPVLGWIFSREWGENNSELINRFMQMSFLARKELAENSSEQMQVESAFTQQGVRFYASTWQDYAAGIPHHFDTDSIRDMRQLLQEFIKVSSSAELWAFRDLPMDIFWQDYQISSQLTSE